MTRPGTPVWALVCSQYYDGERGIGLLHTFVRYFPDSGTGVEAVLAKFWLGIPWAESDWGRSGAKRENVEAEANSRDSPGRSARRTHHTGCSTFTASKYSSSSSGRERSWRIRATQARKQDRRTKRASAVRMARRISHRKQRHPPLAALVAPSCRGGLLSLQSDQPTIQARPRRAVRCTRCSCFMQRPSPVFFSLTCIGIQPVSLVVRVAKSGTKTKGFPALAGRRDGRPLDLGVERR